MFQDLNVLLSDPSDGSDGVVTATIGGVKAKMLIDSGASVNAISTDTYNKLLSSDAVLFNFEFEPVKELRAYASDSSLRIIARFNAKLSISFYNENTVESEPQTHVEEFYVIENAARCLLSKRTSLRHSVLALGSEVRTLKQRHSARFDLRDGGEAMFELHLEQKQTFQAFDMEPVKLRMRKGVVPTKIRYTNIPFHMRDEANAQIEELVRLDVIEEVSDYSKIDWISSMLAVVKQNGRIRLVVDLRGPNKAIIRDSYRMPTLELVVSKLAGCKFFSTIDLTNAFYHIQLDKSSRHITTFWTGEKYYQFKRLPFGLSNAPDIFQRALQDVVLKGCGNTLNYLDDILIFTKTHEQHETSLSLVLNKLKQHNVRLNTDKCKFNRESVTFLGFELTGDGMSITEDRLKAFKNLRPPENVQEVKSYLGMLTFLERFIVDRASKTSHLRKISNSSTFVWTQEAQNEFEQIKEIELKRIACLDFYNPAWKTELFVDASATGLGAILAQFDDSKNLHIICCASKALTVIEQRYPQQHREALAMVWGVERFRFYLLGTKFIIRTDNRANEFIFGSDAYIQGKRAVNRSQLFALRLQPYNFDVKRIPGEENGADALSRLISHEQGDQSFEKHHSEDIFSVTGELSPISLDQIEEESGKDELFLNIKTALELDNWSNIPKGLRGSRDQLRMWGGILYFDERFYAPMNLRMQIMSIAHIGHISASSMKQLLREYTWWPGMTVDIDSFHADCRGCSLTSARSVIPPLSPRALPRRPLEVVHLDFLKLTGICELLVATDAYSRYLWVIEMKSTSTKSTNKALMSICDCWGKPSLWQSDNGPQFISKEFKEFWKREGVETQTTIPYASHTNGLVERHNGPIIHAVNAALTEEKPWRKALANYVKAYNTRPHSSTLFSPFHLLQGRKYHDYLPVFDSWDGTYEQPPPRSTVKTNHDRAKDRQKRYYDIRNRTRESGIAEGDWVIMKNVHKSSKMEPKYQIPRFRVMRIYKSMAIVRSQDGKDYIRWIGHLKPDVGTHAATSNEPIDPEVLSDLLKSHLNITPESDETGLKKTDTESDEQADEANEPAPGTETSNNDGTPVPPVSKTISLRNRKLINIPARYLDCLHSIYE